MHGRTRARGGVEEARAGWCGWNERELCRPKRVPFVPHSIAYSVGGVWRNTHVEQIDHLQIDLQIYHL